MDDGTASSCTISTSLHHPYINTSHPMNYYPIIANRPSCTDIQAQIDSYTWPNTFVTDPADADIFLVAGGDGFFLETMRAYRERGLPFFGLHCGTLWFLLNHITDIDELPVLREDIHTISNNYLEVTATDIHHQKHHHIAINDCVIGNSLLDYFQFVVENKQVSEKISGSGLLISTPIWSTGYSLNNAVPLLPLSSDIRSISWLATRPFHYRTITPSALTIHIAGKSSCVVGCDGYGKIIPDVTKVVITQSIKTLDIAFCKDHDFQGKRIMMASKKLG